MKHSWIRRAAAVPAALLLVSLFAAATARAQGAPDFSKIEIKTTKVADNFYTLEGTGGMIGVLAGPQGIFMVDTQFAPLSDKLVAAIKQINPGPDQVRSQHARPSRPYRRERQLRQAGRDHFCAG